MRLAVGIALEPGEGSELVGAIAKPIGSRTSSPAGIFPFRFGRQSVTICGKIALTCFQLITPRYPLFGRSRVAELNRRGPCHLLDRVLGTFAARGIRTHDSLVILLSDFVSVHQECANRQLVCRFSVDVTLVAAHG